MFVGGGGGVGNTVQGLWWHEWGPKVCVVQWSKVLHCVWVGGRGVDMELGIILHVDG